MNTKIAKISRLVRAFAEHPATRLTTGLILFLTALYEIEEGLLIELKESGPASHHGVAAFGVLTMVAAIPDLLEGLVFGTEYIDHALNETGESSESK